MQSDQVKAIVERVKIELTEFYNGDSWVTDNFSNKVLSLEPAQALKKIPRHNHSVAELVAHITAWRNFVLQKLAGNNGYDIEDNSLEDWPEPHDWIKTCDAFKACREVLLAAIENFPVDRWNAVVPGRNYSFLYLINGIIQHDYYHYGQIGSVLAAIKSAQ